MVIKNNLIALALMACMTASAADTPASADNTTSNAAASMTEENVEITCEAGCEKYNEGSLTCMNNAQFRCGKMGWQKTGEDQSCQPIAPPPSAK